MKCKRCGRELHSKKSIKRGMGIRCARITELEKPSEVETIKAKHVYDIHFLKMEVKTLKRQVKALTVTGVKSTEAIERIKQDIVPKTSWEGKMKVAVKKELKAIFSDPDWKHKLLHSVDEQDTIREPSKVKEVN